MSFGLFARRSIRRAYIDGMLDYINIGSPSPGVYGEHQNKTTRAMDNARRAGFEDAKAGKGIRWPNFDPECYRKCR